MQKFSSHQFSDAQGAPEGGQTFGPGFAISWQRGPLGRGATRSEPNGAFVETVLEACKDRLTFYQNSKFACDQNEQAIRKIEEALALLALRTATREARSVEGTNEV